MAKAGDVKNQEEDFNKDGVDMTEDTADLEKLLKQTEAMNAVMSAG